MRSSALAVLLLLIATASDGSAQAGLGIPGGIDGYAGYGFEGTDGATGDGFRLGIVDRRFAVHLHRAELDDGRSSPDGVAFTRVDGTLQLDALPSSTWLTAGGEYVNYETSGDFGEDLDYRRVRYNVGIAAGTEIRIGAHTSLIPFVAPSLGVEIEEIVDADAEVIDDRFNALVGGEIGLSLAAGPVLLSTKVRHYFRDDDDDLGGENGWAFLSVGIAWMFGRDLGPTAD